MLCCNATLYCGFCDCQLYLALLSHFCPPASHRHVRQLGLLLTLAVSFF